MGTNLAFSDTYRHQNFETTGPSEATFVIQCVDEVSGVPVPHAQVFALRSTGPRVRGQPRFLGFSSTAGLLTYESMANDLGVFLVTSTGEVASVERAQVSMHQPRIHVSSTGRVVLAASLRPVPGIGEQIVTILFEPLEAVSGAAPVLRRFASEATGWTVLKLPPGWYRATIANDTRTIEVEPRGLTALY